MSMLPIFVISLPESRDRRNFMEKQFNKIGRDFIFSSGYYGDDERVIAAYDNALALKENERSLTKGERGCAFAHQAVYRHMEDSGLDIALILEDDVYITRHMLEIIEKVAFSSNRNWDWVSFAYYYVDYRNIARWIAAAIYTVRKAPMSFFYIVLKAPYVFSLYLFEWCRDVFARIFPSFAGPKTFYRPLYNAGCYLITKEGIEKLKPLCTPLRFTADRLPNQGRLRQKDFIMKGYVPQLTIQNFSFESINESFSDF